MNLEKYRVPESVLAGEWIELPESGGARFLVKLPSLANREWQREMLRLFAGSSVKLDAPLDDASPDLEETGRRVRLTDQQIEAFHRLCVVQGPEGFDLTLLLTKFYPALVKLFRLAQERAEAEAAEVRHAAGES